MLASVVGFQGMMNFSLSVDNRNGCAIIVTMKERVKYNPDKRGEKTLKTIIKEVFLQFDADILKAENLGNTNLSDALRKHKETLYLFDYKTLKIICDYQD